MRKSILCLVALAFAAAFGISTPGQVSREHELKAVLLYNLAQFVEWPTNAFAAKEAPIIVGIVGRDPFGEVLDRLVKSETVNDRRIIVERYASAGAIQKCHILFVSSSEQRRCEEITSQIKGKPILTVGEFETFSQRGGMVEFFKNSQEKIRLRVNLEAVRSSGLSVNSKLLRLAEIVGAQTPKEP